jgi:uncharacterized protein involved in exopolysaccharide biosynthesis
MSLAEIAALLRRRKVIVVVVLVLAVGILLVIKKTPQTYQESATVVFTGPRSVAFPNPYSHFSGDLISTGYLAMLRLNSLESAQKIRADGGSAQYSVKLVNLYNLQYPAYDVPYATLASWSQDPAAAQRTFAVVERHLNAVLVSFQANIAPENRIISRVVGDSGAVAIAGSSKRVYGGMLLLTMVLTFMAASALDRQREGRRLVVGRRFRL